MKYALIIGSNKYDDQKLAQLKTPAADSQALAKILDDKTIGSFDEVTPLINQTETKVRRAISAFLTNKKPDDLVLLYFSGHGILDDRGRLYLALKDTQVNLLKATSIPSSFIADEMDTCRSKRQILILDCCHSGAFERGAKGEQKAITETTFEGSGFGRVVLTASNSTQYALEGDQVIKQTELSLFTHFLLEGLKTGEADVNNDGHISLDEWYDYTYARVISETPKQVPHKWSYNQQGDLIIAKNPYVKKKVVELPYELLQALESQFVSIRESGVTELGKYLRSRDAEMVDLAIASLERMKQDDSRRISSLAEKLLAEFEQTRAPVVKVASPKPAIEPEAEQEKVISAEALASAKIAAEHEAEQELRTLQPKVEKVQKPADRPLSSQKLILTPLFWLKWIGATVLVAAILNSWGNYLYNNGIFKPVPILFGVSAGLVSLTQWFLFQKELGKWWIPANVAAGIIIGLIFDFLAVNYDWWDKKDRLFTLWVIGNLVLGLILMRNIREVSADSSPAPLSPNLTIEYNERWVRQSGLARLLSIYLGLAAVVNFLVVCYETGFLNISVSDSLIGTSFFFYGIAGIVFGVFSIRKKQILRNFGFITLAAFSFLTGLNAEIYVLNSSIDLFPLLGFISLASGVFFISQRDVWKNKSIGFLALAGCLIAISLAFFGISYHAFLIIAAIFALTAAMFFLFGNKT